MKCDYCGDDLQNSKIRYYTGGNFDIVKDTIAMPFNCRRCGGSFCSKHRLPENHACPGLVRGNVINVFHLQHTDNVQNITHPAQDYYTTKTHFNRNFSCKIGLHNWGKSFYDGSVRNKNGSFTKKYSKICTKCEKKVMWKKGFLNSTPSKIIFLILAILFAYFFFMKSPINLELIDDATTKYEISDVSSFFDINKTNHYAENDNSIFVGGDGHKIYLQNNPDAIDPTYSDLLNFIKKDKTDQIQYTDHFVCADYAELVHNNAEANGIRAAWVAVSFYDDDDGHSLNAFNTLDKGLVYIDSTGGTEIGPCSYDRLIGIKMGTPMWYYELYDCNDDYYYPPFISSKVESIEIIW